MFVIRYSLRADRGLFVLLSGLLLMAAGCSRAPEGMVLVPAGEFVMGTEETDAAGKAEEFGIMKPWFVDEHPARRVTLPAFYLDLYEVTHDQYRAFIQATGRRPPSDWMSGRYNPDKGRHPVVYVNWEDANAYCLWAGKRLPTEAEWEKAARGPDGLAYPWGNAFDASRANVNNENGSTVEVGHYPAGKSPYGAYDLTGNVWEWTADWYQPYPGNSHVSERFGEKAKVLRGNSWAGLGHYSAKDFAEIKAHYSRAGYRLFMAPGGAVNDVGFRCAKTK